MVIITRANNKEIFEQIIENAFPDDKQLIIDTLTHDLLAYNDVHKLKSLSDRTIDNIQQVNCEEGSNVSTLTNMADSNKQMLRILVSYVNRREQEAGMLFTYQEWMGLTPEDFHTFRSLEYNVPPRPQVQQPRVTTIDPYHEQKLELEVFKHSIKRDTTVYPTLREDQQWDTWNRSTLTLARTHDVSEVFDDKYEPTNDYSKELFKQKQAFVYSDVNKVLSNTTSFVSTLDGENANTTMLCDVVIANVSSAETNNTKPSNEETFETK